MHTRLTKYNSFEKMKQDIHPATLSAEEKAKLDAEAQEMAELLQALRAKKRHGSPRK